MKHQTSEQEFELCIEKCRHMIRCKGKLLRNREDVQDESATNGYVQYISFR